MAEVEKCNRGKVILHLCGFLNAFPVQPSWTIHHGPPDVGNRLLSFDLTELICSNAFIMQYSLMWIIFWDARIILLYLWILVVLTHRLQELLPLQDFWLCFLSDLMPLTYLVAETNAEMLLGLSSPEFLQEVSRPWQVVLGNSRGLGEYVLTRIIES